MSEDIDVGPDPTKLFVAGDWHGNLTWARNIFWYANRKGADVVLQVGDFGFWTPGEASDFYLAEVEREAQEWGIRLLWLDGNHEDHSRRAEFNDPVNRPNTIYLPRGYRWSWWGKRFMAVGGASSVDKAWRKEGVSWWPQETLTDEEVEYASRDDGIPVDYVFAHDCPKGVDIPGVGPDTKGGVRGGWPPDALCEAEIHRGKLCKVWETTMPTAWVHGHYHIPYVYSWGGTEFVGLGRDGDLITETICALEQQLEDGTVALDPLPR